MSGMWGDHGPEVVKNQTLCTSCRRLVMAQTMNDSVGYLHITLVCGCAPWYALINIARV